VFLSDALTQAAVHWVLACVFLRFIEDNGLVDRPWLAGPGPRMALARDRHLGFFRQPGRGSESDVEYLLAAFDEAAALPALGGLFDKRHNPVFRLPLSADGARALRLFLQKEDADTGALVHDFTDVAWGTRFLGDLYQDLSEAARKRYALLQTPEFVERFILERTLDPAIREFGFRDVRLIDPACGSGHFLLGAFERLNGLWALNEPGLNERAAAQRALDAVAGVDINPFAAEIARFRLLLAALRASGIPRLKQAPDFKIRVAVGDSLLHGPRFGQLDLGDNHHLARLSAHRYASEDNGVLTEILSKRYHAVVANPPYITPKDPAENAAYRELYTSCHMKYGLGVPFIQRCFNLALNGRKAGEVGGFVGLIVANSFMKREFGKKLIEEFLPSVDLTHVIDTAAAHIPNHGTATAILLGRNRAPVDGKVRTVMGIKGEPFPPDDPAKGLVWSAICAQVDDAGSESEFISVADTPRETFGRHPWSIGGGGAADVYEALEENSVRRLKAVVETIGVFGMTNADEAMLSDKRSFERRGLDSSQQRCIAVGDDIRDWAVSEGIHVFFPYLNGELLAIKDQRESWKWMWPSRTTLGNRATFSKQTYFAEGRSWWEWHQIALERLTSFTITFAFVATHNHFALDRGGKVFNRTAQVIKLPATATEKDHLALLGLLNSSTASFWIRQVCHCKGAQGIGRGGATELWEQFLELSGTALQQFPIAKSPPVKLARDLDRLGTELTASLPAAVTARAVPTRADLDAARRKAEATRARMIALQEELDWRCYRLYGLIEDDLQHPSPPPLALGERAFEIVMARRMAAGELATAWFERHGSIPITEPPAHWPADYRALVERRIALIAGEGSDASRSRGCESGSRVEGSASLGAPANRWIGLVERPEHKRRWQWTPWEEQEREALRSWLLDRLEDKRFWPGEPALVSTYRLADRAAADPDWRQVAELCAGRPDIDLPRLLQELVLSEAVPFLPVQRYTESGLRKHAEWQRTWELQRREDAIDAEVDARRPVFEGIAKEFVRERIENANAPRKDESKVAYAARIDALLAAAGEAVVRKTDGLVKEEQDARKPKEVGTIPVPPKYKKDDFREATYWRLRGGLDVPKERFVLYPGAEREADGSPVVAWAGWDHLQQATALATYYVDAKDVQGWPEARLQPLLAGVCRLLPWLLQWHNAYNPEFGMGLGDYYRGFLAEEARALETTPEALAAWAPPARTAGRSRGAARERTGARAAGRNGGGGGRRRREAAE
jgi:hypothetical protein